MTRKDSEKDAERPHYYSQFWLDIAAGRRVIGGPKPEDAETNEPEAPEPASAAVRKTGRSNSGVYDGYKEPHGNAVVEPVVEEESEEEEEEPDEALDEAIDEIEMPNIAVEEEEDLAVTQEEDAADEEPENEDFYDEEDETENAEDWDRRGGRKKAKPVRPNKPVKKPKRDARRTF